MLNKKKIFAVLFACAVLFSPCFAENVENSEIIQHTNDLYNKGNYSKAVLSMNRILDLYNEDTMSDNIQLMAEAIYYSWINDIYKKLESGNSYKEFHEAIVLFSLHPEVISPRSYVLINKIYDSEKEHLLAQRSQEINGKNDSLWKKINEKIDSVDKSRNSLKKIVSGEKSVADVSKELAEIELEKKNSIWLVLSICINIFIFIALVFAIIIIVVSRKRRAAALANFKTILEVVSLIKNDEEESAGNNRAMSFKLVESKTESFFSNEESRKNFVEIHRECVQLGKRIDKVTSRKNNSRKVSELVFKMCSEDGISNDISLLYYCAAMIYDAGFLNIPEKILSADHLTVKERYEIRSHVQNAATYFEFIPETIRKIFIDAAEFHHENFDGNGYLSGLRGVKIPYIARMIRVTESYVSLINPRVYHKILDSEAAITELKAKKGLYDPKIISLLEKVVL